MSDFVRLDGNPGALINKDNDGLSAYKQAKRRALMQKEEINTLKDEVSQLKDLVNQLLEKLDK